MGGFAPHAAFTFGAHQTKATAAHKLRPTVDPLLYGRFLSAERYAKLAERAERERMPETLTKARELLAARLAAAEALLDAYGGSLGSRVLRTYREDIGAFRRQAGLSLETAS